VSVFRSLCFYLNNIPLARVLTVSSKHKGLPHFALSTLFPKFMKLSYNAISESVKTKIQVQPRNQSRLARFRADIS